VGLMGDIKPNLKFSPDGKQVVTKDGSNVRLWDVASGKQLFLLNTAAGNPQFAIVPAPAPPPAPGAAKGPWLGRPDNMAVSPDGKVVAVGHTGGPGTKSAVCLWETLTGKRIREISTAAPVQAMAFSPDGKTLAVGGGSMPYRGIGVVDRETNDFAL